VTERVAIFIKKHIGLLIAIVTTIVFLHPTLHNDLLFWDDYTYVTNNALIKNLSAEKIVQIFKEPAVLSHYHPITVLSLSLDHAIGGLDPYVYHLHNLLLHLLNLCLVYILFLLVSKKPLIASIVTLLFCLHPMHIESVAWVSARKDLMYSVFFLLSLIFYKVKLNGKSNNQLFYWFSFLFFMLSLLSKGMAVSLPIILLGMDYLSKRKDFKKMLLEKLPFLLFAFLFVYIGIIGQSDGGALNSNDEIPFIKRPFIACYGLLMYCFKAVVPYNLSAFYPYPSVSELPWYIYASVIPVITSIIYILKQWRKKPELVFGGFFFLTSIFPVIQIIPFGLAIMADRYTYIPYLGLFFIVAFYFEKLYANKGKNINYKTGLLSILVGYTLMLGTISFNRSKVWKNDDTLWSNVIKQYPNNYFALANLGNYWFQRGDNIKAFAYYNKTIAIEERYFMAFNNRGLIHQTNGDIDKAIADFNKTIQLKDYPKAYIIRGVLFFQQGENAQAKQDFKEGIALDDTYALAWFNLGSVYYRTGQVDSALVSFDKAEELGYNHLYLYLLRADLYNSKDLTQNAFQELEKSLAIYPNNKNGLIELSKQYLKSGKMNEALLYINKTIELYPDGKFGEAHYIRSIVYKEMDSLKLSKIDLVKAKDLGYDF
jgi:tetratricopeptide (TPR) repeat protein